MHKVLITLLAVLLLGVFEATADSSAPTASESYPVLDKPEDLIEGPDDYHEYLLRARCYFAAFDAEGNILCEDGPDLNDEGWTSLGCFSKDMITLHPYGIDSPTLEDGGKRYRPSDYFIMVVTPQLTRRLHAMHPSGEFYKADFSDGTRFVLRLPEVSGFARGGARWDGQWRDLVTMSALEFTAWVMGSYPWDAESMPVSQMHIESAVAEADCRSLLASVSGSGRREALLDAAAVIQMMLEEYHSRHGHYPADLSALTRGSLAILPLSPANPFRWPEQLTDRSGAPGADESGLVYLGFGTADGETLANSGYALGVLGPGEPDIVPQQLGTRLVNLPAAIRWLTGGVLAEL